MYAGMPAEGCGGWSLCDNAVELPAGISFSGRGSPSPLHHIEPPQAFPNGHAGARFPALRPGQQQPGVGVARRQRVFPLGCGFPRRAPPSR